MHGIGLTQAVDDLMSQFNYESLAGGLVVFFAFIPFFAIRELTPVLGEGTLFRLFFQSRSAVEPGDNEAQNRRDRADSLDK
jgi:hypothetical protein